MYGGHGLLWSLAMHSRIPADLAAVHAMPARMLWQSETMMHALDRIAKRARLEADAAAAHKRAQRAHSKKG